MQEIRTSIFAPAISSWVEEARELVVQLREAEAAAVDAEQRLTQTREQAQMRRFEVGSYLLKVRDLMPKRGTKESGWKAFLEAIEIDDSTAHRYMELARGATSHEALLRRNDPEVRESPQPTDIPPPTDGDAPAELLDTKPNRGAWCTPKDWAGYVGKWDGDPFSNPRSHIATDWRCMLEDGGDGFGDRSKPGAYRVGADGRIQFATKSSRIWLQPDYAVVLECIEHWGHTRFGALLRLDTSTEWFEQLWSLSEVIMIPRGTRLEFEPPPGVEASSNPYPHGFYYKRRADVTKEIRARCFEWRVNK